MDNRNWVELEELPKQKANRKAALVSRLATAIRTAPRDEGRGVVMLSTVEADNLLRQIEEESDV